MNMKFQAIYLVMLYKIHYTCKGKGKQFQNPELLKFKF